MDTHTQKLIRDIEAEVRFTRHMIGRDQLDPRVMAVMASIPREQFIPPRLRHMAYVPLVNMEILLRPEK
ncbi:MAG: hypothetical protein OEY43_04545 [Gammaproteobacteria bacterium]|nr:hypothetical protein [Gammaproteobacteria bacterium]